MPTKFLGYAIAAVALIAQPVSATAQEMCITRDETRMALSYLAPILVEGLVKSCTPHLTADAPLLQFGPQMAGNYRGVANATDTDMMELFIKIGDVTGDPPPPLPIEKLKAELVTEMSKDIKADDCAIVDKFAADLSALPAANILGLIETGIFMAEFKDRQKKARRTKKPIAPSIFCTD